MHLLIKNTFTVRI